MNELNEKVAFNLFWLFTKSEAFVHYNLALCDVQTCITFHKFKKAQCKM